MNVLAPEDIVEILGRYLKDAVPGWEERLDERTRIPEQLAMYLGLLLKWNERTNLTAIREPSEIVRRHFGESLFAAVYVKGSGSLLDYGSGAGFPGVPIQLWHPELRVTLAESQGKKAAFLREVLRSLELPTEVWSRRAEELLPERRFDAVVMRAVDVPQRALGTAFELTRAEVWVLGSEALVGELAQGVRVESRVALPQTHGSFLFQLRRDVFHVEQSFGV